MGQDDKNLALSKKHKKALYMLLYTPLCWLLAVALGLEAIPLTAAAAAIPILVIAAFLNAKIPGVAAQKASDAAP